MITILILTMILKNILLAGTGVTLFTTLATSTAHANPSIQTEAVFELQFEDGHKATDNNNERSNTFARSEIAPTVTLNDNFFIDGVAVFEQLQSEPAGNSTFFDNEGLFIEELKLNYANNDFSAFIGKFNPAFGIAWDYGRGVWSEDYAEDYEITEMLGFGAAYSLNTPKIGTYTFTASTFYTDTSSLSDSAITARTRTDLNSGGAANTESLNSYVVSVDAANFLNVENLTMHLSHRHLARGEVDTVGEDEKGYAVNIAYTVNINDVWALDNLIEYAAINNFGADSTSDDRQYLSASVISTFYENWNITTGFTQRRSKTSGNNATDDYLIQVTGGYAFKNGLTLEAGWKSTNNEGDKTHILGGLARYTINF